MNDDTPHAVDVGGDWQELCAESGMDAGDLRL